MKNILALLLLITICTLSSSQVSEQWVARYEPTGNDKASLISLDTAGNVYISGYTYGGDSITTAKYNPVGVLQWIKSFKGGIGTRAPRGMAVDIAGNVYITGEESPSIFDDYFLLKYNTAGEFQWVQYYNVDDEGATAIALDNAGNICITGACFTGGYGDVLTIKYNPQGIMQWAQTYNAPPGNLDETGTDIGIDDSNNVYVSGQRIVNGLYDFLVIKYNSVGIQQWVSVYDGPDGSNDYFTKIAVSKAGNCYITGRSYGSTTDFDYATVKYNLNGVQQWVQRYNGTAESGSGSDYPYDIAIDKNENVIITGQSQGLNSNFDYVTVKYSPDGIQKWVQRYNGPGNGYEVAYAIAIDSSGNAYVTGTSWGSGTYADYATIKYNAAGALEWVMRYNGPVDTDDGFAIAVNNSGSVFVTGWSRGTTSGMDYCTIKYSQLVNTHTFSNEIPEKFALSQNYPNPFNPFTKIEFDIPKSSFTVIKIYDILGRVVSTLVNEQLKPGVYEVTFDGTNLPSGVYFYRIEAGTFIESKKMVLIK